MTVKIFPAGPYQTNSFLIVPEPAQTSSILASCDETREAAIVDPAFDETSSIFDYIEDKKLNVTKALITHSHWDHIAGLALIKKKYNAEVCVHIDDVKNVESPGSDGLAAIFDVEECKVDRFLSDGDIIKVGDIKLEVFHTPGHSPGSVCFYCAKEGFIITGDTLFKGTMGNISLPTAEIDRVWPSLERLSKLPPDTIVYPGHGELTTIGNEPWLATAKNHFQNV